MLGSKGIYIHAARGRAGSYLYEARCNGTRVTLMDIKITGVVPPLPGRLEQGANIPGEDEWILEFFHLGWVTQKLPPNVHALNPKP